MVKNLVPIPSGLFFILDNPKDSSVFSKSIWEPVETSPVNPFKLIFIEISLNLLVEILYLIIKHYIKL